ncbi:HNH endonuclease [Brevundimonas vancanneytii]|uniref:HNH endonuclease n=1 Tax=Brevundimonas vancanneytii TaxID=1325724 RepID=A0A4P1JVI6_9CAUL|nr:HNH endonuclease [Brevundimonas vancanneytii]
MQVLSRPPSGFPALVLNADFRPLSYFPLSLWPWEEVVKAVWQDRVDVVATYDKVVRSPSLEMPAAQRGLPEVLCGSGRKPAFTRFNVFLRDGFACQYCGEPGTSQDLTFDHVIPRSRGGAHDVAEHRRRLRSLQPAQGRPHARSGPDASAPHRPPAQRLAASAGGAAFPAPLPAPELARLPLLGHRAGALGFIGLSVGCLSNCFCSAKMQEVIA